jgi:ring-1,2-phenylacetyl-CoA epoxidase subunit PaaE
MFLEETLALKNRYIDRFVVHFLMSREPQQTEWLNGRIDGRKVRELAGHMAELSTAHEYLICGPGDMVDEVRNAIKALNDAAPVRFERFASAPPRGGSPAAGAPAAGAPAAGTPDAGTPDAGTPRPAAVTVNGVAVNGIEAEPAEILARISVVMDGRRRNFTMAPSDPSVLVAAERAGLNLPFSCRSGICATCRARITEGAAVMTHNIALEPWETDAGFVLCCQARPTTATLELSYDHK